jgi:ribosomal protein S3
LLYGYKFHFSGRFTRKQKAASLWFLKGSNSVSSTWANIDYGAYTITLRYSTCSLKVWLYKNKKTPVRNIRVA